MSWKWGPVGQLTKLERARDMLQFLRKTYVKDNVDLRNHILVTENELNSARGHFKPLAGEATGGAVWGRPLTGQNHGSGGQSRLVAQVLWNCRSREIRGTSEQWGSGANHGHHHDQRHAHQLRTDPGQTKLPFKPSHLANTSKRKDRAPKGRWSPKVFPTSHLLILNWPLSKNYLMGLPGRKRKEKIAESIIRDISQNALL